MADSSTNMDAVNKEKQLFNKLLLFYDIAEKMLDAVESDTVENGEQQFAISESMMQQIQDTTDALTEEFTHFCDNDLQPDPQISRKMDAAIRQFFAEMDQFKERVQKLAAEAN